MHCANTVAPDKVKSCRLIVSCCLQRESDRLEREVREWTQSKLDATHALYERHNKGKSVEARARQQLTSAGRDITKGWTTEQCIGRAAVLVMKSMTRFSEHTLGLAYGLLDSHHFKLQHDSVIDKVIATEVASAGASKVQLAVLFQGLLDKQSELTGLADAEYKSLKQDREQEANREQNKELMNKLVGAYKPQQGQQARAGPAARAPLGSVGGCRYCSDLASVMTGISQGSLNIFALQQVAH